MDNKIRRLIVSNKNEKKNLNTKVYVYLTYLFENNKKHFYLAFGSDIWHEWYFLPLNHIKKDGTISSLNTFPLYKENMGFNLEEIWKTEKISLYNFLNESLINDNIDKKEDFALKVTKFMYVFLSFPFEETMKILNWIHNSNYNQYSGEKLLLKTFDIL